jgi:hypothetical protein
MKILNFLKKKKSGSALFIFIMIFFGIFIIAFGSAYIVFLNINKMSNSADNLRAYYAAKAGVERAKYEAIKNNYNFSNNCNLSIFSETLSNDSTYSINCTDNNFYSVGAYNNSQVALKINGINIMEECSQNYLNGSLCGGGKLFKSDSGNIFIISPPDCDQGFNCNNNFSTYQYVYLPWDDNPTPNFWGATSRDNGLNNIAALNPQSNQNLRAAKFCDDANFNGYDDWYLPAIDQLSYFNSGNLYYQYYGFDPNEKYWSSTEIDPGQQDFCFAFLNGEIIEDKKLVGSVSARCIRNIP